MWHASAAHAPEAVLRLAAIGALDGVGDASRGEWHEWTGKAYHVRRRLNEREEFVTGPVRDIRGTEEQELRWRRVKHIVGDYKE